MFKWHVKCNLYGPNYYWCWVFFMSSLYISMRLWVKIFLRLHGAPRLWNLWYIFKSPSIFLPTYLSIHPSINHPSIIHPSFISFHTSSIPGNINTLMSNMVNIGRGEITFEFFNLVNWLLEFYAIEINIRFQCINAHNNIKEQKLKPPK